LAESEVESSALPAVALVVAPVAREHGLGYLFATVVLAGIFQIFFGAAGFARVMRFVPRSVMVGFVNGATRPVYATDTINSH
jgi:SulP family sulfate permease